MLTKIVNGVAVQMSQEEEDKIKAEWQKNKEELDKTEYLRNRQKEYPSIPDQLDLIYEKGLDAWKAEIKKVKDKYPKPTE